MFDNNKDRAIDGINRGMNFHVQEFDSWRNDKEFVLIAIKRNRYSIRFASPQIQALCESQDPIKVLTKAIELEKLHAELEQELSLPTPQQTIPKKPNKL